MFRKLKNFCTRLLNGQDKIIETVYQNKAAIAELKDYINNLHYRIGQIDQEYLSAEYITLCNSCHCAKPKKRILLCGFYGAQNVGDELMLQALLQQLPTDSQDLDITILVANNYQIDASEYAPYRTIHFPQKSSDIAVLAQSFDYFIVGGGALLDDKNYRFRDAGTTLAYIMLTIAKTALKFHKHVLVMGVSANQVIKDQHFKSDLQYIIDHADDFSLRDNFSLETLAAAGIDTKKIHIIDDLAMALPIPKDTTSFSKQKCLGVNLITNIEDVDNLDRHLEHIICEAKRTNISKLIFIPFYNYQDTDRQYYSDFIKKHAGKHPDLDFSIADQPKSPQDLQYIYSNCQSIISMRYHAALLALAWGHKIFLIDYSGDHEHYFNKNRHIIKSYCPNLPRIALNDPATAFKNAIADFLANAKKPAQNIPNPKTVAAAIQQILKQGGIL